MEIIKNSSGSIERNWYRSFCSEEQIDRILDPQSGRDELLRLRADTIADNVRLYRVYRHRAQKAGPGWNFEDTFQSAHFHNVLGELTSMDRKSCKKVTFGNIFSNVPNGNVFHTAHGTLITVSESLRYFLKFSHLAILEFGADIPMDVRVASLRIAIRIMLEKESMDFDLDPRGIIPKSINDKITNPIQGQLQFIAGHEFAHHLLGHLTTSNLTKRMVSRGHREERCNRVMAKVFNTSQREEFEADIQSILLPRYSKGQRDVLLGCTLLWFACLELFESVEEGLYPKLPWSNKSHPTAMDRYQNLLDNVPFFKPGLANTYEKELPTQLEEVKKLLQEDICFNPELYEFYGSIYLSEPDTKWRGRVLVDRVDY